MENNNLIDLKLECSIIGYLIENSNLNEFDNIINLIGDNEKVFFEKKNRILFNTIKYLKEQKNIIDIITVIHRLRVINDKEITPEYVINCVQSVTQSHNIKVHIFILSELYFRRSISDLGVKLALKASDFNKDILQILLDAEEQIKKANSLILSIKKSQEL